MQSSRNILKNRFVKRKSKDLYHHTMEKFPSFMKYLIDDLQQIDGYTENEIAFGSGISLDALRKLTHGRTDRIDRKTFQEILHFYVHAICGWCAKKYKHRDFETYEN